MAVAPFKVVIPSRGKCIGVAAHSYEHLRDVLKTRYKVKGDFSLQQEDGTLVCDEDYFQLLQPNTKLSVVDADDRSSTDSLSEGGGYGCGHKRSAGTEADSSVVLSSKRVCIQPPPYHKVRPQNVVPHNSSTSQGSLAQLHHQVQQPLPPVPITPQNRSSQLHVQMMSPSCNVGIQSGHLPSNVAPRLMNSTDSRAMQNSLPSSNLLPSIQTNGVMNRPLPSCYNAGILGGHPSHLQPTSQSLPQHRIVSPCQTTTGWPTTCNLYSKSRRPMVLNPSCPHLYHQNMVQQGVVHPASFIKPGYQLVGTHQLPQRLPQQQPPAAIPYPMPHPFAFQTPSSRLCCNVPGADIVPPSVAHTFPVIQNFQPNITPPASVSEAHIPTCTFPQVQKPTTATSHTTTTSHSVLPHSSTRPLSTSERQVLNSSAELQLNCSTGLRNISSARRTQITSEYQTPSVFIGCSSASSQNPPLELLQSSCSMNSANLGCENQCMYTADQPLLTSPSSTTNLPVQTDRGLSCENTSKGQEKQSMDSLRGEESLKPAVSTNEQQTQTPLPDISLNDGNTVQPTNSLLESVVNEIEQEQAPLLNECSILQPSSPIFDLNLSITKLPSLPPSPIKNTTLEVIQCSSNEVMEAENRDSEDDESRLCIVEDVCETSSESDKFPEVCQPQGEKSPVKGHLHTSLQQSHLEDDYIDDEKEEEQNEKNLEVKLKEEKDGVKEEEEEDEVERRNKEKNEDDHLTIIIVDSDEESSVNHPSPDEGYSSSTSPLEPTTNFISKLPFQSFDQLETPLPALRPAGVAESAIESASEEEELQHMEDTGLTEDEIVDVVTVAPEEDKWKPNTMILSSLGSIVVGETSEVDEVEVGGAVEVGDEVVVGEEYVEDGEESDIEVDVLLPSPLPPPMAESPWEECRVLASGSAESSLPDVMSSVIEMSELIVSIPFTRLGSNVPNQSSCNTPKKIQRTTHSMCLRKRRRKLHRLSLNSDSNDDNMVVCIPQNRNHIGAEANDHRFVIESDCVSDCSEASDVLATIECVAASLQQPPEPRRAPQIIHLEPHLKAEPTSDKIATEITSLPTHLTSSTPSVFVHHQIPDEAEGKLPVQVEDFGSEVIIPPSHCLAAFLDVDNCIKDLLSIARQTQEQAIYGDDGDDDVVILTCPDVGDEVELQEACNCEVTGMDLLNLGIHEEVQDLETETGLATDKTDLFKKFLTSPDDDESVNHRPLSVQTLTQKSGRAVADPREQIQTYSFGHKTGLHLIRSGGEWKVLPF